MPRNVVTLSARAFVLPSRRNAEARRTVVAFVTDRFRARAVGGADHLEMDFPKRLGGRAAKEQVARALDEVEPRWRRLYVLYPTESALREAEKRSR